MKTDCEKLTDAIVKCMITGRKVSVTQWDLNFDPKECKTFVDI